LWVGHDGDAAYVLEIRGRQVEFGAEIFGFGGYGITIRDGEVGEPMSRGSRLAVRGGRNAADKLFTVLNVPIVVCGVFVFLHDAPAEKCGVEVSGAGLVGRAEVGPAEGAVRAGNSGARISLGLPEREHGAGGVLQDGHASGIHDVEGRSQNCASEFGGAGGGGVGVLNGDVEIPVRRHTVLKLVGTKRAGGRGVASLELEDGVNAVRARGNVVGGPAKDLGVEGLGRELVGGGDFHPAKVSWGVLCDVWHGRKILQSGGGGKGRKASSQFTVESQSEKGI
jgi:hypothetical protein